MQTVCKRYVTNRLHTGLQTVCKFPNPINNATEREKNQFGEKLIRRIAHKYNWY